MKNQIPNILAKTGKTKYWLWQTLGGSNSDRSLVYRLAHVDMSDSPIPPATHWGTVKRIAAALGVTVGELEA